MAGSDKDVFNFIMEGMLSEHSLRFLCQFSDIVEIDVHGLGVILLLGRLGTLMNNDTLYKLMNRFRRQLLRIETAVHHSEKLLIIIDIAAFAFQLRQRQRCSI